ncbi:MAG: LuxR C-terminal-related transcriptional regulator [Haliea sp.]|uniref:LuxR C-terminal-related transcriptional regulator n=1 Tax=Haliea sp. TaxID=1932666 RepID=UPI0032ED684D
MQEHATQGTPHPATAFPPWLTVAKVYPPSQRLDALARRGLELRLNEGLSKLATIVSAPAGYGKSTLIANWLRQLPDNAATCCWLAIDEDDNDDLQLLTYLAFSLSRAGVLQPTYQDSNAFRGELTSRQILSLIQHSIDAWPGRVLLVIDDFEKLRPATISAIIQPLLRYAPRNLHLCIATRDDSELDVSRHEVDGQVQRLDPTALQFTLPEIQEIFSDQLPAAAAEEVYRRTRGWPVAVQMLRSALASERDHERVLQELGRDTGTLSAYLAHQILESLEESDRQFLMSVAPLERVDCQLANHVLEVDDSLQRIHRLQHLHSLIRPISGPGDIFQLHPLLREHLYRRLQIQDPARLRHLHARIAGWHAHESDLVNAVRHCVLADNPGSAIDIIESMGTISLWLREGITRIRTALGLLDTRVIGTSPLLLLLQSIIEVKDGLVFRALQTFREAEQLARDDAAISATEIPDTLLNELRQIDAYLAIYAGRRIRETSYQALLESTPRIDRQDPERRAFHYNLMCVVHTQQGDFRSARHFAREAIRNFREIGSLYGESYLYFHLGDASFAEGESARAEELYRVGLDIARRKFSEDKGLRLIGHVLLFELLDELDRDEISLMVLRQLPRELEAREAWFDIYLAGYCTVSNIEYRRSGLKPALRLLDRAMKYADQQRLARLEDLLQCQRIELLVRAGKHRAARAVLTNSGISLEAYRSGDGKEAAWRERDVAALAISRLLLAEGRSREALAELEHFSAQALEQGRLRSSIRYAMLMAQAALALDDREQAREHTERGLALSRRTGFVRALVDDAGPLDNLIALYLEHSEDLNPGLLNHAVAIRERLLAPATGGSTKPLLSKREQEVLALLTLGAANKVIARDLDLSENTVRFHLKNIFAKLNVRNRVQAVSKASMLGLTAVDPAPEDTGAPAVSCLSGAQSPAPS